MLRNFVASEIDLAKSTSTEDPTYSVKVTCTFQHVSELRKICLDMFFKLLDITVVLLHLKLLGVHRCFVIIVVAIFILFMRILRQSLPIWSLAKIFEIHCVVNWRVSVIICNGLFHLRSCWNITIVSWRRWICVLVLILIWVSVCSLTSAWKSTIILCRLNFIWKSSLYPLNTTAVLLSVRLRRMGWLKSFLFNHCLLLLRLVVALGLEGTRIITWVSICWANSTRIWHLVSSMRNLGAWGLEWLRCSSNLRIWLFILCVSGSVALTTESWPVSNTRITCVIELFLFEAIFTAPLSSHLVAVEGSQFWVTLSSRYLLSKGWLVLPRASDSTEIRICSILTDRTQLWGLLVNAKTFLAQTLSLMRLRQSVCIRIAYMLIVFLLS